MLEYELEIGAEVSQIIWVRTQISCLSTYSNIWWRWLEAEFCTQLCLVAAGPGRTLSKHGGRNQLCKKKKPQNFFFVTDMMMQYWKWLITIQRLVEKLPMYANKTVKTWTIIETHCSCEAGYVDKMKYLSWKYSIRPNFGHNIEINMIKA